MLINYQMSVIPSIQFKFLLFSNFIHSHMKPSAADPKPNESQDSLNLDDNYNEEETLNQTHKV